MNNYIITSETMAILPYGDNNSLVYETNKYYVIKQNPNYIVKQSCLVYGSSLKGRLEGTKNLTGYVYKAPIILNDKYNIILFPTTSPRLKSVEWISLNHICKFYDNPLKKSTYIHFNNGKLIEFSASLNIIRNQILRATHLDSKLKKIICQ